MMNKFKEHDKTLWAIALVILLLFALQSKFDFLGQKKHLEGIQETKTALLQCRYKHKDKSWNAKLSESITPDNTHQSPACLAETKAVQAAIDTAKSKGHTDEEIRSYVLKAEIYFRNSR